MTSVDEAVSTENALDVDVAVNVCVCGPVDCCDLEEVVKSDENVELFSLMNADETEVGGVSINL